MAAWPFDKWIFEYKSDGTEESFLSINKLYLAIKYQSVCVCVCMWQVWLGCVCRINKQSGVELIGQRFMKMLNVHCWLINSLYLFLFPFHFLFLSVSLSRVLSRALSLSYTRFRRICGDRLNVRSFVCYACICSEHIYIIIPCHDSECYMQNSSILHYVACIANKCCDGRRLICFDNQIAILENWLGYKRQTTNKLCIDFALWLYRLFK